MGIEREVKLRGEPRQLRQALEDAGAQRRGPRLLEDDLVLDTSDRRLAGAGELLRLRRRGDEVFLTFKAPVEGEASLKVRQEWQTPVRDGATMLAILQRLGYRPAVRYQKYRTPYRLGAVDIALDETPLGGFLELEGDAAAIERVAALLGFGSELFDPRTYLEIHHHSGGEGDMLFEGAEVAPWGSPRPEGSRARPGEGGVARRPERSADPCGG